MNLLPRLFPRLVVLLLLLFTHMSIARAAFFQLAENSPAGLGNAFAGGAAIAEDASTVWYNPAGLTRLPGAQFVWGAHFIKPSINFSKTSATTNAAVGSAIIGGGNGNQAGENAILPNFYYSQQLNDHMTFGFGVNVPFGLATDYDNNWVGRYYADRSEIQTVNLNPSLGYKLNDQFSIGGGVSFQRLDAELTQAVDFGSICTASGAGGVCGPPAGNDGRASVMADGVSYGFNLGTLWSPQNNTRLGLAYRSKMHHKLVGTFGIQTPANVPGAVIAGTGLRPSSAMAYVTLPDTLSLSAFHQLNSQWAIMGDVTRTRWSTLPELRINFPGSTQGDSVVTLNLNDVNRYSVGASFTPNTAWTYRAGMALDQAPTSGAEFTTPRLPDAERKWLALGVGYKQNEKLSYDFSYVHIKVDDTQINKIAGASSANENFFRGNLAGDFKSKIDVFSVQAKWIF